ncbi:MAG: ferritin-like domain-containing protein [Halobacteriota archaeon]
MTELEARRGIPDVEALARLLEIGVVIEEYAEEKSARLLSSEVDDAETREVLLGALDESLEHRDRLVELVALVGGDVDAETVERRVREAVESSVDEPTDEAEALRRQLESELMAYEFYDSVLDALDEAEMNCVDSREVERVTSTLREIRSDEMEDARELRERLG